MQEFLFLILARSGSKGVPDKNIHLFGGIPALGLRILAIQNAGLAGDIVISTDAPKYADMARQFGARAPFLRPAELCRDDSTSVDAILHALAWLEKEEGKTYRNLVLIEPSSPFCRPQDMREGVRLLTERRPHSVLSVKKTHPNSVFLAPLGPQGEFGDLADRFTQNLRRQDFAQEYTPNGCFYGIEVDRFKKTRTFYGASTLAFPMEEEYSVEIDTPADLRLCEFYWEKGLVDNSHWIKNT